MTKLIDATRAQESVQGCGENAATSELQFDPENYLLTRLVMKDLDKDLASTEYELITHQAKESCRLLAKKAAAIVASNSELSMNAAAEDDNSVEIVVNRRGNPKCLNFAINPDGIHVRIYLVEGSTVHKKQLKAAYVPVDLLLAWLQS